MGTNESSLLALVRLVLGLRMLIRSSERGVSRSG